MRCWLLALAALAAPLDAAPARYHLANQSRWEAKAGYYLSFENDSPGDAPALLAKLKLVLGVADGQRWRFVVHSPAWALGRDYQVRAEIGPTDCALWLDEQLLGRDAGGFQAAAAPLEINAVPPWADGATEYLIEPRLLQLDSPPAARVSEQFPELADHLPLVLFGQDQGQPFEHPPGPKLAIDARFRLLARPDVRQLAPMIDRYGQARHADWPDKVRRDEDLRQAAGEEERRAAAWGVSPDYDRHGGWLRAGWQEPASGFYRVVRRDGWWWLITPEGHPCFYLGLCTAPALNWEQTPVNGREYLFEWLPPRSDEWGACWGRNPWGADPGVDYLSLHTANLIRRDGADWRAASARLLDRRVHAWGFSGLAKWGGQSGLTSTPVLGWPGVPRLGRHPDTADPAVRARCREALRRQIEPRREDPSVLGWSIGNEYGEIVTPDEILDILGRAATVPAKQALVDQALKEWAGGDPAALARRWQVAATNRAELLAARPRPAADDVSLLRRFWEERYYAFCYETVKSLDPHHLYLGNWVVPGWWVEEADWELIARWCDVVGYDRYATDFADERLSRLMAASGKPVLCGEFSFPPRYAGLRGYGKYPVWARDAADAGTQYQRYVGAAARHPLCVGACWFEYRDQPLTGRGPGHGGQLVYGEHYAFGMVDVTDRPKWELVERVREANLAAVRQRQGAAGAVR